MHSALKFFSQGKLAACLTSHCGIPAAVASKAEAAARKASDLSQHTEASLAQTFTHAGIDTTTATRAAYICFAAGRRLASNPEQATTARESSSNGEAVSKLRTKLDEAIAAGDDNRINEAARQLRVAEMVASHNEAKPSAPPDVKLFTKFAQAFKQENVRAA